MSKSVTDTPAQILLWVLIAFSFSSCSAHGSSCFLVFFRGPALCLEPSLWNPDTITQHLPKSSVFIKLVWFFFLGGPKAGVSWGFASTLCSHQFLLVSRQAGMALGMLVSFQRNASH